MPYSWEKKGIKLGKDDRRRKLSNEDKEQIRYLYKEGKGIREIAREYEGKCSRRLIQFVIFPERLEALQKRHKEQKHWKKYYDKKKQTKAVRNWRVYKNKIIKKLI